jgi:hypothetical protein
MGREVLAAYRNLEGELMRSTIGEAYKQLEALLVPEPQQTETKQV